MPSRAGARPSGLMPTRRRFGPLLQLVLDARVAREPAFAPPPLLDRPLEPRLDRARRLVDVVAVEAKARLQPQRVARAEADRLHALLRQQQARQLLGLGGRNRNLEAVLAGVARARDVAVELADLAAGGGHERQARGDIRQLRQHVLRRRPLQRQQRALRRRLQPHIVGQPRGDVGVVHLLARGVHHQHQRAVVLGRGRARHHQVVDDAAVVVQKLGVALLPGLQVDDVGGHQRLQRGRRRLVIGPDEKRLAHVRDIEQARPLRAYAGAP